MNFSCLDCAVHGSNPMFSQTDIFCKNKDNYVIFLIGHYLRFHLGGHGFDEAFSKLYNDAADQEARLRIEA